MPKLRISDIATGRQKTYEPWQVRAADAWAYNHLVAHDCGSLSCGKTIYQLLPDIPTDRDVPPGVNAEEKPQDRIKP